MSGYFLHENMAENERIDKLVALFGRSNRKRKNTKGDSMSAKGVCELCGEEKNLKNILGKKCCTTCELIRRGVKNKPEIVVSQLSEWHGDKYFPETGGEVNTDEIDSLNDALAVCAEEKETLTIANNDLAAQVMELEEEVESLTKKLADLQDGRQNVDGEAVQILSLDKLILKPELLKAINVLAGEVHQ